MIVILGLIQTHKQLKRMLFMREKHNMQATKQHLHNS